MSDRFWKGAHGGCAITGAIALGYMGMHARTGFGTVFDIALLSTVGLLLLYLIAQVAGSALAAIAWVPRHCLGIAFAAVVAIVVMSELPTSFALVFAVPVVAIQAILCGSIAIATRGSWQRAPAPQKLAITLGIVGPIVANAALVALLISPGFGDAKESRTVGIHGVVNVKPLAAPDPSLAGGHVVRSLTYGSGKDQHRPEFGTDVDLVTPSVDARAFLSMSGFQAMSRRSYWGFSSDELPRNGRVWYPDGQGPFPLVLIVHGNDNMTEPADAGYRYLCELLASRGFIATSVDQCFLGSYFGTGGLRQEMDARAWLLLKHLELWRDWNGSSDNPFSNRVDLDRIALIGHSRGGEAVAHAAKFNQLSHYPDDATITFDWNFGIQALVAIAPSDRQYEPAGTPTELIDVSYLLLQGSYDADVSSFVGLRQYQRIAFTEPGAWFKSVVYIERANHGQFNTVWGNIDAAMAQGYLLNVRPLLTGEDQRQIAKVYVSAFLEATLHRSAQYRQIFRDHRPAMDWLPDTGYVTQYRDSLWRPIAAFEEDIDVTTTTLPGGTINGVQLTTWREGDLKLRGGGTQQNHVSWIGWGEDSQSADKQSGHSAYVISLGEEAAASLELRNASTLTFDLLDARAATNGAPRIDFTIELEDESGERATVLLSDVRSLPSPFESKFTKIRVFAWRENDYTSPCDNVLQRCEIPLERFATANENLDVERLSTIRFRFDRSPNGKIVLDGLGIQMSSFRSNE